MKNYQSTHTGAEIDAGIDLLDNNTATDGQVLTANGTGGATWQDAKGTEVVANPSLAGTESDLTGLEVAGTKYKVPTGGSGGTSLFKHKITIQYNGYTGYYTTTNNESTEMSIPDITSKDGELNIIMKKSVISGEPGPMEPQEVHTAFLRITDSSLCFFTTALTESVTGFWYTDLTEADTVMPL